MCVCVCVCVCMCVCVCVCVCVSSQRGSIPGVFVYMTSPPPPPKKKRNYKYCPMADKGPLSHFLKHELKTNKKKKRPTWQTGEGITTAYASSTDYILVKDSRNEHKKDHMYMLWKFLHMTIIFWIGVQQAQIAILYWTMLVTSISPPPNPNATCRIPIWTATTELLQGTENILTKRPSGDRFHKIADRSCTKKTPHLQCSVPLYKKWFGNIRSLQSHSLNEICQTSHTYFQGRKK